METQPHKDADHLGLNTGSYCLEDTDREMGMSVDRLVERRQVVTNTSWVAAESLLLEAERRAEVGHIVHDQDLEHMALVVERLCSPVSQVPGQDCMSEAGYTSH